MLRFHRPAETPAMRLYLLVLSLLAGACAQAPVSAPAVPATAPSQASVFAMASPLSLQAPQFDRFASADFQPALEEGMRRQIA
ncbi:MAG: hypothetical protein H0W68_01275, partial [Gemmatimonadaceae bacterium]|nr:hypothetical protein [Gemmatimonadaceae bacterium]